MTSYTSLLSRTTRISDELAAFLGIEGGEKHYKLTEFPLLLLKRYQDDINPVVSVRSCNLAENSAIREFLELPEGENVPIFKVQRYLVKHYRDHPKGSNATG